MRNRYAQTGLLLAAVFLAAGGSQLVAGECITASTKSPIVTPDGAHHDGGTLKACLFRQFSESAGVFAVTLNDHKLGNFMSRIETMKAFGNESFVQFRRLEGGELLFEGFAVHRGNEMQGFRMQLRLEGKRPYYPKLDEVEANSDVVRFGVGG